MSKLHLSKRLLSTVGALTGLASGIAYQHHLDVMLYQIDDVSHAVGLYLWIISTFCWILFAVLYMLGSKKR